MKKCTVDEIVIALCADYARRKRAIAEHTTSHRTEMEYRYLNYRIYDGTSEIVGCELAEQYIEEIGSRAGYAKSRAEVSECAYKDQKRLAKQSIARKLHLID